MSLDVTLTDKNGEDLFDSNITHNLTEMAREAGIYEALWRPQENGLVKAKQLIAPLTLGINRLKQEPERYKAYNSPNGWGKYENLVSFTEQYLHACIDNPDAEVSVCR